jgi:hypothetical protein
VLEQAEFENELRLYASSSCGSAPVASRGLHIPTPYQDRRIEPLFLGSLLAIMCHPKTDSSHDDLIWNKSRDLLADTSIRPAPASCKSELVYFFKTATRHHGWNPTIRDPREGSNIRAQ